MVNIEIMKKWMQDMKDMALTALEDYEEDPKNVNPNEVFIAVSVMCNTILAALELSEKKEE